MKKIIFFISLLLTATTFAAKPFGMAGCGLGAVLIGKNGNQIFASTTNGTGTQSFGISSGTSNCVTVTEQTAMLKNFIEANHQALITDMAKGQGDTLSALSNIYGCNQQIFASEIQQSYQKIVTQDEIEANRMIVNINSLIKENSALSSNCTRVI